MFESSFKVVVNTWKIVKLETSFQLSFPNTRKPVGDNFRQHASVHQHAVFTKIR